MSSQNISSLLLVFASCLLLASSNNAQRTEGGPSKGQKGEPASSEEQGPRGPRGEKGLPGDFFSDGPIRGRDGRDRDVDLEPLIRLVLEAEFRANSDLEAEESCSGFGRHYYACVRPRVDESRLNLERREGDLAFDGRGEEALPVGLGCCHAEEGWPSAEEYFKEEEEERIRVGGGVVVCDRNFIPCITDYERDLPIRGCCPVERPVGGGDYCPDGYRRCRDNEDCCPEDAAPPTDPPPPPPAALSERDCPEDRYLCKDFFFLVLERKVVRCCEFNKEGERGSGSSSDNDYNDYADPPRPVTPSELTRSALEEWCGETRFPCRDSDPYDRDLPLIKCCDLETEADLPAVSWGGPSQ